MLLVSTMWYDGGENVGTTEKYEKGTGKTAYHLRSLANTGCVQFTTKKKIIAVICMQDIHLRAA